MTKMISGMQKKNLNNLKLRIFIMQKPEMFVVIATEN